MKVYVVKVLKTREQTREQLLKDTIIEDLREQLEKATIDYQAVIAENKMLRERLNGSNNDSDIISFNEFEAIVKAKTREEELTDELGATKMMLSTLRKEHDMLQKQYDGLKKTHEETKEKDARAAFEMGQSHAELYKQLQEKTTELKELKKKYEETVEHCKQLHKKTEDKVSKDIYYMKISNMELSRALGQKTIDYNVLKGEYDHLKEEFNKLYSQYLSYMDKTQKFIADIKGEATEKKGDKEQ